MTVEPVEAFVCRPLTDAARQKYAALARLDGPLPDRLCKLAMDKIVSSSALVVLSPVFGLLYFANLMEGWLIPENRGPFIYSYVAASAGRPFRKHKIRQIKMIAIDRELAARGDWLAFAGEWSPQSRTRLGSFVKALYLDELPQLWDVLLGNMSLVGPRALAWAHYQRDVAQGNAARRLLKAGLLGPGQALKGTTQLGDPSCEFEYLQDYLTLSAASMLRLDVRIVFRCLRVMLVTCGL